MGQYLPPKISDLYGQFECSQLNCDAEPQPSPLNSGVNSSRAGTKSGAVAGDFPGHASGMAFLYAKDFMSRPRAYHYLMFENNGEEMVVVNPLLGSLCSVNSTGARIIELCDGMHTLDRIITILISELDPPGVRSDMELQVYEFIRDARNKGIILFRLV